MKYAREYAIKKRYPLHLPRRVRLVEQLNDCMADPVCPSRMK